jgi:hypothetical protein
MKKVSIIIALFGALNTTAAVSESDSIIIQEGLGARDTKAAPTKSAPNGIIIFDGAEKIKGNNPKAIGPKQDEPTTPPTPPTSDLRMKNNSADERINGGNPRAIGPKQDEPTTPPSDPTNQPM